MNINTPKYTTIIHEIRIKLDLSCNEYCLADVIYHLSNNPGSKVLGWCYASKESVAKMLGLSKQTVHKLLKKLLENEIIEKDDDTKWFRTTKKWYDSVILERMKYSKESLPVVKKIYLDSKQSLPSDSKQSLPSDSKQSLHNNNNSNNNNKDKDNNIIKNAATGRGTEINEIFDVFRQLVNPTINFGNKTQRAAAEYLIKQFGFEKTKKLAQASCMVQGKKYAPVITTPYGLREKYADLKIFYDKNNQTNIVKI